MLLVQVSIKPLQEDIPEGNERWDSERGFSFIILYLLQYVIHENVYTFCTIFCNYLPQSYFYLFFSFISSVKYEISNLSGSYRETFK